VAVIKTFKTGEQAAAILEDPIPGSTYLYFRTDAYNKTSLTPQFDAQYNFSPTGALYGAPPNDILIDSMISMNTFGHPILSGGTTASYNISHIAFTGVLVLNGEVTHCCHFNTGLTTNDYRNNLDHAPFFSMDPTTRPKPASYFTDGTSSVAYWVVWNNSNAGGTATLSGTRMVCMVNARSADIASGTTVVTNSRNLGLIQTGAPHGYPMYRNPSTGNMVWAGAYQNTAGYYPTGFVGYHTGPAFGPNSTSTSPSTGNQSTDYSVQFVGISLVDGLMITLQNYNQNDYTHYFYKYNDGANTTTQLNLYNTAPSASGSSVGGNRATTQGGVKNKFASRWFTDPLAATSRGFYMPYVDTAGNYAPFYFQWNTTTDNFSRNATNCTVGYGANSLSTYWSPDGTCLANSSTAYAMQTVWFNETFTVGSNRYLLFMQLNGTGQTIDSAPKSCTFICYSVNAADPRVLTYHSSIPVPSTPKNIVFLNDALTILGVFCLNNFYIYTFTEGAGWTRTASLPYQFSAVGRDNLGRIWGVEPGPYRWGRIHLISLSVPVTIVVTPDATTYTYAGTPITGNLAIKALDASGNRISTTVKLVIDGGSMLFGGSNYTTTVTTSASADVNAAVTISGGGVSNIIASVSV